MNQNVKQQKPEGEKKQSCPLKREFTCWEEPQMRELMWKLGSGGLEEGSAAAAKKWMRPNTQTWERQSCGARGQEKQTHVEWEAGLVATVIYYLSHHHTMASRKRCLEAQTQFSCMWNLSEQRWSEPKDSFLFELYKCWQAFPLFQHKMLSRIITVRSNHRHLNLCHR